MTNGEKFEEVFPNMRIDVFESYAQVMAENYEFNNLYPLEWWNAEYKEPTNSHESEVEWLKNIVEDVGSGEDVSPEEWNTILLTSIANSLAIIADTFKK